MKRARRNMTLNNSRKSR